ncbi:hypothetical protein CDIK_0296 [Cucumispora dikerogammari]|nr:hypothetical protein CDIK_0296 [Cucumispora dikerogammari]
MHILFINIKQTVSDSDQSYIRNTTNTTHISSSNQKIKWFQRLLCGTKQASNQEKPMKIDTSKAIENMPKHETEHIVLPKKKITLVPCVLSKKIDPKIIHLEHSNKPNIPDLTPGVNNILNKIKTIPDFDKPSINTLEKEGTCYEKPSANPCLKNTIFLNPIIQNRRIAKRKANIPLTSNLLEKYGE